MMLADQMDGSRLRAFLALAFGNDEAHLLADLDVAERIADDAVPVEIDLAAVRCLDDAVTVFRKQLRYATMGRYFVAFDIAASASNMVFKLAPRSVEGIADSHIDVLMGVVRGGIAPDHHFSARNRQIDTNMIEFAFVVMCVWRFDNYSAAGDAAVKLLKSSGSLADALFNSVGMSNATEADLHGELHGCPPLTLYRLFAIRLPHLTESPKKPAEIWHLHQCRTLTQVNGR
jgi:hypothetical protein